MQKMPNLWVKETFVNASKGCQFGDSDVYETCHETMGSLYRAMVKEYGRCTSKVYIDTEEGSKHIGWVFISRCKYEDSKDTYLREVWASVHTGPPTRTMEYHYA